MSKSREKSTLPETAHLIVTGVSDFGDLTADTVKKEENPKNFKIYVAENRKIKPPLEIGDRFLARIVYRKNSYSAHPIVRTMQSSPQVEYVYGVLEKKANLFFLKETEKNSRMEYLISDVAKAKSGDFVKIALEGVGRFKKARVVKSYGKYNLSLAASTLILDKYGIPIDFSDGVLLETKKLPVMNKKNRVDYTNLPFVTIDGDDSKDFDDAIYAEKSDEGYKIWVAIADVAFYVREGTNLDREAFRRGNSVYLPNMTIPMLPKILSNDLCSLNPNKERAAIVCSMHINQNGDIKNYNFERAVIKSHARLTYKEVQDALEGNVDIGVLKKILPDLYGAFVLLNNARKKRGALELETTEVKIKIDKRGKVVSISPVEIYTSNQIVEEFMIAANVAAANACEKKNIICMYRVHDKPKEEKLKDLEPLLRSFKLKMPDINALKPEHFNKLIQKCDKRGLTSGVSELILRCQSQAVYCPENIGHFGLALKKYAHFTSPIRRYADLLVHRALITALGMHDGGGLEKQDLKQVWKETGIHISDMERRAVNAERDITSRFVADYLKPMERQIFKVKVSGVSRAGVFVSLENFGAEGLIPMRYLDNDNYVLEKTGFYLEGKRKKQKICLGDELNVCLCEASPLNGGLIFDLVDKIGKTKKRK